MAKKKKKSPKRSPNRTRNLQPVSVDGMDRKFQISNAADTLIRSEEIKSDKGLMGDVKKELKKRAVAATKAAGKVK